MLLEQLRHSNNPRFSSLIFRKNNTQIFSNGGLWDNATALYPMLGAVPRKTPKPMFVFPSGMKVTFGHLERYQDCLAYQGAQIPLICFDELTHFDEDVFWYMLSRNRSDSGVSGYVRATTNPDPDSWVRKFIDWWIDKDGYAVPERSGVIRWFIRVNGEVIWADTKKELIQRFDGEKIYPKSVTFICSTLADNAILMKNDPSYLANLKALPLVEQERLLGGNWNIRASAGLFFKRSQIADDGWLDEVPDDVKQWVRGWDLAATDESEGGEPAYTAGVLMGKRKNGKYVIADVTNVRLGADGVRKHIKSTSAIDKQKYKKIKVRLPQDPGQAGKAQSLSFVKMLAGFSVVIERESGSKETRAEPFAAQWQAGNVQIVKGEWNESYLNQLEAFPEGKFKDMVDASSSAFGELEKANTYSAPPTSSRLSKVNYWSQ